VLAEGAGDVDDVRIAVAGVLHARFGIDHATLQMETRHCGGGRLHD
jgi:cobalt-zinc-cadmium efflux system protein